MKKPYTGTKFATDTATIAIFDPSAIAHRASDDVDWWSVPTDEVLEINQGNVMFVGLGTDGGYDVEIYRGIGESNSASGYISAFIKVNSGCIYIGAGEKVPAGDYGPGTTYGGTLISAERGTCELRLYNPEPGKIVIEYEHTTKEAKNNFRGSPRFK